MERKEFLKTKWLKYPAALNPELCWGQGWLSDLVVTNTHVELSLWRDGKTQQLQVSAKSEIVSYLLPGDLVAVSKNQEVFLLAPGPGTFFKNQFPKLQLQNWNRFLRDVREFFETRDFVEVKTPQLVTCPGTEPSLDVFSTELKIGSRREKLFLPTSPELHLKKALSLGGDKIFELAWCYRNGEKTERHQPEFLMLEWYRAFDSLHTIKADVVALVETLAEKWQVAKPRRIHSKSLAELFREYCDFELTPETQIPELQALAKKLSVDVHAAESIDDYFFLIFMEKIEFKLPPEDLIFVEKYPPYQAALARLTPDGWGDRFEVYWRGMELANAFHELNDPAIQRMRSLEDLEKKTQMAKEPVPLDEEFFTALESGLPPAGGIALGVERLYMALTGVKNIGDLRLFPL